MGGEPGDVMESPQELLAFAKDLFPINRSLTGPGNRETLRRIQEKVPTLAVHEVPSGTECFDWKVPPEWVVHEAYLVSPSGERFADFAVNNLHLVGYSTPIDQEMSLEELQPHLYSLPGQPDAIPYVTSYYAPRWGFCLTDRERQKLAPGQYRAVIRSELRADGHMTYGECLLPGESNDEVLLSTYICHPSMANNETSGMVVTTALAMWLQNQPKRRYTYRIVFIPETIGSIYYVSRHREYLREHVRAGFVVTCVGDDRSYSYLPSRRGGTLADRVALHVLSMHAPDFRRWSFLDRGSDERQYCSPHVDLPVASVMRTKYAAYPEYHTSLDNFDVVTGDGLYGAYTALCRCLDVLERDRVVRAVYPCEPQLGKRGLYSTLSQARAPGEVTERKLRYIDLLAYADGEESLLGIAERLGFPFAQVADAADHLLSHGLIEVVDTN